MKDFLNRAYRLVNDEASDHDHELTNIHACIGHVLVVSLFFFFTHLLHFLTQDARKTINKFITEQYRELAMWSVALLINSCTWVDFKCNWRLICLVFLQLHLDEEHVNEEHQDALLDKISKIKSDPNILDAIKTSDYVQDNNETPTCHSDIYDFDGHEGDDTVEADRHFSRSTKKKVRNLNN